ncbi:tetratricopeptide repeat protein [bacterium]|nr:tetratricopeptide repeat protein [bacterium]MBU1985175.1 tetratricopeptide repeat protein [bacterium]
MFFQLLKWSLARLILSGFGLGLSIALPCWGQGLAGDSALFARYWQLVETGDSAGATSYLFGLTDSTNRRTAPMAGLLLGWTAYNRGDYTGVSVQLDLGVPAELADHALFLRGDALERANQKALAIPFWDSLARDTTSVYGPEARVRLADWMRETGEIERFLELATEHRIRSAGDANRQRLDLTAAEIMASLDRHEEAVEILFGALVTAPATDGASQIHNALAGYRRKHGFIPRGITKAELDAELAGLEGARAFRKGLHRVHSLMQTSEGPELSEALTYYQGRFESGLKQNRKAISSLQNHLRRFPDSRYRTSAEFYLGRSAYLSDEDTVAVKALLAIADQDDDLDLAGRALELLGTLYLERDCPHEAEIAFRRWQTLSRGTASERDCLWRLGWSLWETDQSAAAAEAWQELFSIDSTSAYAPVALYWSARALARAGRVNAAARQMERLYRLYPHSFYAVTTSDPPQDAEPVEIPLRVPTLDDIWSAGARHAKRFCLLTAMRLPKLALREWPRAQNELPAWEGLPWWEAQLHLWNGDRTAAMRVVRTDLAPFVRSAGSRPADFFAVLYPLDFDPQIIKLARQYGIDPYFAFALICQESHFNPAAVSSAGATGLMQLMPETARIEARKLGLSYSQRKLADPDYNLKLGMAHLAGLLREFSGDSVLVLAAYNAGKATATKWTAEFNARDRDEFIELIPYRETRLFVKRIFEHRAAYRRLYPDVFTSLPAKPVHEPSTE